MQPAGKVSGVRRVVHGLQDARVGVADAPRQLHHVEDLRQLRGCLAARAVEMRTGNL
jgi:hypothetical protein